MCPAVCSRCRRDDRSSARGLATQERFFDAPSIDLVKAHDAHACVSAGQYGRTDGDGALRTKMLPGWNARDRIAHSFARRPHLYVGPRRQRLVHSGAVVSVAVMGSVLAADLEGAHARPRVGLLNIGEEEIKGNDIVQAAHNLLTATDINYVGFVEGHDIFSDKVDCRVTDGLPAMLR